MPRIAGIIVNLVPYHHVRWEAYARLSGADIHLVALTERDQFKVLEYNPATGSQSYQLHTLFKGNHGEDLSQRVMRQRLFESLDQINPDVLCVSGWGLPFSLAAINWAIVKGVPIVMLSESNEFDEARSIIKEYLKRSIVSFCSAGLAGGAPQAEYLIKLGIPRERVFQGYDVVDNSYFSQAAEGSRGLSRGISKNYFLACARFGRKKNLSGLVRAYALYRSGLIASLDDQISTAPPPDFDLIIAGDGEERPLIENTIQECGVSNHVHLVGAKGYEELPFYYANAGAFIHASTTEQWGLVVNEAMASGLPVLVSNRCGCAKDLVKDGGNGWTFDPADEVRMAELMKIVVENEDQRLRLGEKSKEIISEWGPERFARGIDSAVNVAFSAPVKNSALVDRLMIQALSHR